MSLDTLIPPRAMSPIDATDVGAARRVAGSATVHWWRVYWEDVRRYQSIEHGSALKLLLLKQGLWALLQYRAAAALYTSSIPKRLKDVLLVPFIVWRKVIEILTGIHLPHAAVIDAGLYVGHYGNIFVNPAAIIGKNCNLAQGVTLGVAGEGELRGAPILGNDVHAGPNAVIAGRVRVGDHAMIGASSLVLSDVPPYAVVVGVPARVLGSRRLESPAPSRAAM